MKRIEFISGQKINGIEFIKEVPPHESPSRKTRRALFKCYCGNEFETIIRSIISGNTKSCGCFGIESRKKRFTKHGKRNHPIYGIWCTMKSRCYNKRRNDFKYYGGRGIKISDEFKNDFKSFFDYVVSLPGYENRDIDNLTIDRINNNKDYMRTNLRWATRKQQANNRSNGKNSDRM